MKFTLLKLSALTLIAVASTVSAKNGELRGSKKPLPELNGAIQMVSMRCASVADGQSFLAT